MRRNVGAERQMKKTIILGIPMLALIAGVSLAELEAPATDSSLTVSKVTVTTEYYRRQTNTLSRVTSATFRMQLESKGSTCLFDTYPNSHKLELSVDGGPFRLVKNFGTRAIRKPESIVALKPDEEIDVYFRGELPDDLALPIRKVCVRFTYPDPSQYKGFEESLRTHIKDRKGKDLPFWFGTVTSPEIPIEEKSSIGIGPPLE